MRGAFERNSKLAAALEKGGGVFLDLRKRRDGKESKRIQEEEREFIESTQRGRIGADDEEKREET